MSKKLVVVLVIIFAIGASLLYVFLQDKDKGSPVEKDSQANTETKQSQTQNQTPAARPGVYVDYSDQVFASTQGTRLLFFHAPWCPQCRELDESIKNSELPDDTTIFKIDYDSNQTLRAKYGVTLQTTVVKVDHEGNKTAGYVAYDEPTFESVKRALLP